MAKPVASRVQTGRAMTRTSRLPLRSTLLLLALAACGPRGATSSLDAGAAEGSSAPDASAVDAGAAPPDAGHPLVCPPPPAAPGCADAGDSSWVRGVARFDPARIPDGGSPAIRFALRHPFTLYPGEDQIGGRLHMWTSVSLTEPGTGEVPFSIDMCGMGTAMWSEENGTYRLIAILDVNGNNDIDLAVSNDEAIARGRPDPGEPTGMIDVPVSCHAASPCLELNLGCYGGTACTTITPLVACTPMSPGCASDAAYCQ